MAINERYHVTLTKQEVADIRARLGTSQVSAQLFEAYVREHNGEKPPYLVATLFDFLPPGTKAAIFLYDPALIEELHQQKMSQLKMDRQGFQTILKFGLGPLTTQRISKEEQRLLRKDTQKYLDVSTTTQNVAVVSEIARNTMEAWKEKLQAGKAVPLSDANLILYIEYVAKTMIGTELSARFKEELKWQFLEGVESAILPHWLQKISNKRAASITSEMKYIIMTHFEKYILTGEKSGVIDDHLEFFLKRAFVQSKDEQVAEQEFKKLRQQFAKILKEGSLQEKVKVRNVVSKVISQTTEQAKGTISAGFETTANVSAFIDVMAATYPGLYKEVVAEVAKVEDIGKLTFHEMVMCLPKLYAFCAETLLHYPPLGVQFREALADGVLQYQGQEIDVKKGALIFPDHLSSAKFRGEFNPSRQLEIFEGYDFSKHLRPQQQTTLVLEATAHQAFEARGLHNCIGKFMAVMELMVTQFWKAKYFPQPILSVPENVDPTQAVIGATNSLHKGVMLSPQSAIGY